MITEKELRCFGSTGYKVSPICFGALTIGPLQRGLSAKRGSEILLHALESGINFVDTAELYGTYEPIRLALKKFRGSVVVATKSYAFDRAGMEASLEKARRQLDLDVIPVFLMHEQESQYTLKGHGEALDVLVEAKLAGKVGAIGISTHHVAGVRAATAMAEIDVISPLINASGVGIQDGSVATMLTAIRQAKAAGKALYGMKPFGGGHLLNCWQEALSWLLLNKDLAAVAIGMKSEQEVDNNLAVVQGRPVTAEDSLDRKLHVEDWCIGCGDCVATCSAKALSVTEGKARVDPNVCIFCGYCGAACPEFALKVI